MSAAAIGLLTGVPTSGSGGIDMDWKRWFTLLILFVILILGSWALAGMPPVDGVRP